MLERHIIFRLIQKYVGTTSRFFIMIYYDIIYYVCTINIHQNIKIEKKMAFLLTERTNYISTLMSRRYLRIGVQTK